MTYIEQATERVVGPRTSQSSANWFDVFNAIRLAIPIMIRCLPSAIQAYDYFTREYWWWERLFGMERRRDGTIRSAIAEVWQGPRERLPEVQRQFLLAAKNGAFTVQMIDGAFREWKSQRMS